MSQLKSRHATEMRAADGGALAQDEVLGVQTGDLAAKVWLHALCAVCGSLLFSKPARALFHGRVSESGQIAVCNRDARSRTARCPGAG
jgi:hypothetical protein